MAIQTGSTVWLKTGSAAMLVKSKAITNDWICDWQVKGVPYTELYAEEQLTDIEPEGNEIIDIMI